jgi:hypothetical protein
MIISANGLDHNAEMIMSEINNLGEIPYACCRSNRSYPLFVIYDVDDSPPTPPVSWQFPSLQLSRHHEVGREPLSLDVAFDPPTLLFSFINLLLLLFSFCSDAVTIKNLRTSSILFTSSAAFYIIMYDCLILISYMQRSFFRMTN